MIDLRARLARRAFFAAPGIHDMITATIARELGYQEGWRMIAPRNLPSLRTLRAGGSTRIVGEIRFLQLLSLLRARFLPARFRV